MLLLYYTLQQKGGRGGGGDLQWLLRWFLTCIHRCFCNEIATDLSNANPNHHTVGTPTGDNFVGE